MNEMQFNNQNLFGVEKELRNEKKGLRGLGYVYNLFSKDYKDDYLSILQKKFLQFREWNIRLKRAKIF